MPIIAFQTPARSTSAPENGVPIQLMTPTADTRACSGTTSNVDTKKFAKKMPVPNPNPRAATFRTRSEGA